MRKTFAICLLAFLFIANALHSQGISAPANTIETLLCKKWVIDYALIGKVKDEPPADQKDMTADFRKNKTFTMTMGGSKHPYSGTGTWKYDPAKKLIKLTLNGSPGFIVVAITETELTMMVPDMQPGPVDNELRIVYKVRTL